MGLLTKAPWTAVGVLAALALCGLIVFYDLHHKRNPLSPLLMAGNRVLVYLTAALCALFVLMYGTLYFLLLSEDHALLTGSALVFGVLAVVMLATRRLDWAALAGRLAGKAGEPKPAPA